MTLWRQRNPFSSLSYSFYFHCFIFVIYHLPPIICVDVRDGRRGGRESRVLGRQRETEPYQRTGTWLDIILIDTSNNCPSLVWWSLSTKPASWNEPPYADTGIVTHRASCSLRPGAPANRSFSFTVVSPWGQNSLESGHLDIVLYLAIF